MGYQLLSNSDRVGMLVPILRARLRFDLSGGYHDFSRRPRKEM